MGCGSVKAAPAKTAAPARDAADSKTATTAPAPPAPAAPKAVSSATKAAAAGATSDGAKKAAGGTKKAAGDRPGSYRAGSVTAPAGPKASAVAAPKAATPAASPQASSPAVPGTGDGAHGGEGRDRVQPLELEGLREAAEIAEAEDQVPDMPGEQPNRTVVRAGMRPPNRCMSMRSQEAMSALGQLEARLKRIEDRVSELDKLVRVPDIPAVGLGKAKTELAMLEADAHKLESSGVDNIYTSELESGKDSAKETKKEQLRRLEALFNRIDEVFSYIQNAASAAKGVPELADVSA